MKRVDGQRAALRAVKDAKGGGHTGAMTVGIVVTAKQCRIGSVIMLLSYPEWCIPFRERSGSISPCDPDPLWSAKD
jgi:hypothetical protein